VLLLFLLLLPLLLLLLTVCAGLSAAFKMRSQRMRSTLLPWVAEP